MTAYLVDQLGHQHLLILKNDLVYIIWEINYGGRTIDRYQVNESKVIDAKVLAGDPNWEVSRNLFERSLEEIAKGLHPKINAKKFLTHKNEKVRKTIIEAIK